MSLSSQEGKIKIMEMITVSKLGRKMNMKVSLPPHPPPSCSPVLCLRSDALDRAVGRNWTDRYTEVITASKPRMGRWQESEYMELLPCVLFF